MNNKIGLSAVLDSSSSLNIIALSLRSPSPRTRALVLEIFGAVCLIPGGHTSVLEGMDHLCEQAGMRWRFEVVVWSLWGSCQGMTPLDKELQVASMSFINAVICGGPGVELEFRMHLRYEFLQLGLMQLIDKIGFLENDLLQTQIDVWIAGLEADEEETFRKWNRGSPFSAPSNSDDEDVFDDEEDEEQDEDEKDKEPKGLVSVKDQLRILVRGFKQTSCWSAFGSLVRHLGLLPGESFARMKYMFIIDKLIQQVVLQRDEEDPDPAAAVAEIDMRALVAEVGNRLRDEEGSTLEGGERGADGGKEKDKGKDEKIKRMGERVRRLEREVEGLRESGADGGKALEGKVEAFKKELKEVEELVRDGREPKVMEVLERLGKVLGVAVAAEA
ncbi:Dishevelled associated activator of morphogenesis 2, partial [Rhizophlyctis rosea]